MTKLNNKKIRPSIKEESKHKNNGRDKRNDRRSYRSKNLCPSGEENQRNRKIINYQIIIIALSIVFLCGVGPGGSGLVPFVTDPPWQIPVVFIEPEES
ncbi:MAG: hypothetical protein U9N35_07040 [Euryarchaeota archaeon]|nr:hypothetical protein [Euryarchaeota archaeon]